MNTAYNKYKMTGKKEISDKATLSVWHVGGEDVRMRIPLLKELRKRGFSVGAIGTEDSQIFANNDIPYLKYKLHRGLSPIFDLESVISLRRLFSHNDINLVHTFDTKPGYLAPFASINLKNIKVVRTVTGMGYLFSSENKFSKVLRLAYRSLYRVTDPLVRYTIFQNPDDEMYFVERKMVSSNKHSIVYGSGIDTSDLDPANISEDAVGNIRKVLNIASGPVVLLVSRLVKHKGIAEYLESARFVRKQFPEAIFLLVGQLDKDGRESVSEDLVKSYEDDVIYLGARNDVKYLLSLSDIFVLPSYYREGVPRVLLEAGSMGLPIITTRMPGCAEVVIDGWNGLSVEPRNVIDLTNAIISLLKNKEKRNIMGKNSRELIKRQFSLDVVTSEYSKIYLDVLKGRE